MQDSVWGSERISNIGWILSRYSEHIQEGDRIRMGIEGDECGVYRGTDDPPAGIVTSVTRDDTGLVKMNVRLETTGDEIELDNRNISPDKVWEVHPSFIDTFRGRIEGRNEEEKEPQQEEEEHAPREHENDGDLGEFRSVVETKVESLGERLQRMETAENELERTIASAVRELAGDLMRTYRGEEPEFAFRYADRYDLALTKSKSDNEEVTSLEDFRGSIKKMSEPKRNSHQSEKYAFEATDLQLRESSVLTDDSKY